MLRNSIKINFICNFICQIITLLAPLIMVPYLSRTLLEEGVGKYSYAESIVSYFVLLAGLGTVTYAQREIGACSDNKENASRVFWEIFIVRVTTSALSLVIYSSSVLLRYENDFIYLILCLNIINVALDVSWFFWGKEEFALVSIINTLSKILTVVLVFIFVKDQHDVGIYVFILSGIGTLTNLLFVLLLIGRIKKVSHINPLRHLKSILSFFVPEIAIQIYLVLDKSMIGWFSISSAENGFYEYADKIVRTGITAITALSTVIMSRTSNYYSQGRIEDANKLIYKALSYTWCISFPIVFGLIATADIMIPLYLGEHFEKSALLVKVLSPIVVFVGLSGIIGRGLLLPFRKQKFYIIAIICASIVNVIINLLLIPRFFSIGAAIGTVCAEFVGIVIQFFFVFKNKMLDIKRFIVSSSKYLLASIIMFIILEITKVFCHSSGIIFLLGLIGGGCIIYFSLLWIFRDKFLMDNCRYILVKIRKNKQRKKNESN